MNAPFKTDTLPQWSLADLYTGRDDPKIEADLARAKKDNDALAATNVLDYWMRPLLAGMQIGLGWVLRRAFASLEPIRHELAQRPPHDLRPLLVADAHIGKANVGEGLGDIATVTDAEEKYGLNWHGKRAARQLALTALGRLRR